MAVSSNVSMKGILRPQELAFLQEVFDACLPRPADKDAADAAARRLIIAYESGVRDKELLRLTAVGGGSASPRPRTEEIGADVA